MRQILEKIIGEGYDKEEWTKFFREKDETNWRPKSADLSEYSATDFTNGEKLGEYNFDAGKKIIISAFFSKKSLSERSGKKAQYEIGKAVLKDKGFDAGIFIFRDKDGNFRFSYIETNYLGIKQDWTNFRRFTYFVSSDPQITNKTFLQRIGDGKFGTVARIKDAFSVEKVTKKFYEEYHKRFEALSEDLRKNRVFSFVAEENNIKHDDFAKKLLGQIVFLYFIQKKGWLGVPKNEKWGNGDRNFMSKLYKRSEEEERNFYNDFLEPLFYDALNNSRRNSADPSFSKLFNSRVPFLNGGLFEPEYDWEETSIYLDNSVFKKIFETFDRFNFTIEEESPDDKEVAIDPEMLGKVFENLLNENLRKGKGTYYTPREIVYYMCKESLINYLIGKTAIDEDKIRKLVTGADIMKDSALVGIENENSEKMLEVAEKNISLDKKEGAQIDDALKEIKVVDPACGSGAFLVGMLNEIVRCRRFIYDWILHINKKEYELKKETIQNCIYGVDIDPGAVDIAKLRLWLSLVVEHNFDEIEPLPNLDYRIMCGNSLLEEFEGVKFYGDTEDKSATTDTLFADSFETDYCEKSKKLQNKIKEYFALNDRFDKKRKQKEINDLKDWLIRTPLERQRKQISRRMEEVKSKTDMMNKKSREKYLAQFGKDFMSEGNIKKVLENLHNPKEAKPFFLWKLEFIDVFENNGGFDVVIANPPYVSVKEISTKNKKIFSDVFETGQGRFNLFTLFLEKADQILKSQGIRTFILPEGLYSNIEYRYIRKHILENSSILSIVLFSNRVFDAAVDTSIISTQKVKKADNQFPVTRDLKDRLTTINQSLFINLPANLFVVNLDDESKKIIFKLFNTRGEKIESVLEIQQGIIYSGQTKENVFSNNKIDKNYKKILDGRDILKWKVNWDNKKENRYICYSDKLHRAREERLFIAKEKLLFPRRSTIICGTYDNQQYYVLNTAYVCLSKIKGCSLKFILAILNSKLINYFYSKLFFGWQVTIPALNSIVIPEKYNQKPFIELVDKILAITKSSDYLENSDKQAKVKEYETQIDQIVYKLYDLTLDEVRIIENSNSH